MEKGRLIVFEGVDGSGKSTQFDLFVKWLDDHHKAYARLRFPRYDNESSALVRMYLGGQLGTKPSDVNAYAASTFYAVDRYASYIQDWREFYQAGGLVIADRYTTSNAYHQGSKLPKESREEFFKWLYNLEFDRMGLPKPDIVLLMDTPLEICESNLKLRVQKTGEQRDIHELDLDYLRSCYDAALDAADTYGWKRISGAENGRMRTVQDISSEIQNILKNYI